MTTVQEIEKAVTQLSRNDLTVFREWFEEYDAHQWDKQFEADALAGKLDKIAEEALTDFYKGNYREL